MRHFQRQRFSK